MSLKGICTRTATIALAAAALAAPAASARPADIPPVHDETTATAQDQQDLRSADAIDAATRAAQHQQDLRSADAIDAATRTALDPQANARADTTPEASAEHGIAWRTIAIGIAVSLLALGIAGITSRTRRTSRARISA